MTLIIVLFLPCTSSALEHELQNFSTALLELARFLGSSEHPAEQRIFYEKFEPVKVLARNLRRIEAYDLERLYNLEQEIDALQEEALSTFGTETPDEVLGAFESVRSKVKERRAEALAELLDIPL